VPVRKERLSKKERLTLNRDFERVFKEGKKIWIDRYLLIIYTPNKFGYRRLGLVVSSKLGKACERNRVKRLLREVFRRNKELFPESSDLVIIPHPSIKNMDYWKILKILKSYLSRERSEFHL
jgi:ribonuclease P protein component